MASEGPYLFYSNYPPEIKDVHSIPGGGGVTSIGG